MQISEDELDHLQWVGALRGELARRLGQLEGVWLDDSRRITRAPAEDPCQPFVELVRRHPGPPRHVDVSFTLGPTTVWDCLSGMSGSVEDSAELAAQAWQRSTAPAWLELVRLDGHFADHDHGQGVLGLSGWHSIHGPLVGHGRVDTAPLEEWCLRHPLIPAIAGPLRAELGEGEGPRAVKLVIGQGGEDRVAEVRIDGVVAAASSQALSRLPWQSPGTCLVRSYVLFMHRV